MGLPPRSPGQGTGGRRGGRQIAPHTCGSGQLTSHWIVNGESAGAPELLTQLTKASGLMPVAQLTT
jgi:hypothetical protein